MLKKILIAAVILLLGLAINVFVYDKSFETDPSPLPDFSCMGDQELTVVPQPDRTDLKVGVAGGEPFKTDAAVVVTTQTCTGQYSAPTFKLSDFVAEWQFYANWLVWALPLFTVAYLINRYAHSRH